MEQFTYESFSDWEAEPFEKELDDEVPQPTPARLSFVLVEDDEPSDVRPTNGKLASSPEARAKRTSPTRPPQPSKKRRTHHTTPARDPSRMPKSSPPNNLAAPSRKTPTHNAEVDVGVPVYDHNDRIPRHTRTHSIPPEESAHLNFSLEKEGVFAAKRTPPTPKPADVRRSKADGFERPISHGSRTPASVSLGTRVARKTPSSALRRTEAAVSEQDPLRSRTSTRISNASKLSKPLEANKHRASQMNPHVPPTTNPGRLAAHPRGNQQRRHSGPASARRNETSSTIQHTTNNHAQNAGAPGNTEVPRRNSLPDPALSNHEIRVPHFDTAPPVVGGPPFPHAFAVPTIPPGGQLRFDSVNMNRPGVNAANGNDNGMPNPHFGRGPSHLGQAPDERVHGLPPEALMQLNRFHPPFLPFSPMTSMMGYQGQLPMQPNFLAHVPQMVVNPYLQSPGGSVYPHQSAHFNPAMNGIPISCNPFSVSPPTVPRPDHEGPSFPTRPTVPQTTPEARPEKVDTPPSAEPTKESANNIEKPRISSDSDMDGRAKTANEDGQSKKNKKHPAKKSQTKKPLETSQNEVDAIPCDEEEDGVDYVSCLNQLPQKKKFVFIPNPRFEQVYVRGKGASGWRCTMIARLLNKSPTEEVETITIGRNKSRAKKAAAKELLSSLKSRVPELFSTESGGKQNTQAIRSQTALNALNLLVREGHLPIQPNCETEEVSENDEDRWRCSATLVTKDHGRKVFAEYGSSKSNARQKWARKALEILIELKSPGAEQYHCIIEPGRAPAKKTFASIPKASEVIVRTSDDEISNASGDDIVDDMDYSLELPNDYELVVAKSEFDCEKWFGAHAQPGAELGAFIDSKFARLSVDDSFGFDENDNESEELKRPILCFSTANSCIVIRIDKRQRRERESHSDHVSDMFWVPEVVAEVLEDPKVQKVAVGGDDGLDLLFEYHGIQCESVQDIAVSSLAIAGYGRVGDSQDLSSLKDLTKFWMRKEAKVISWEGIWPAKRLLVEKWLGGDDKEVALAVLSAYATFCIREKVSDAARMKRMNAAGGPNDLEVLSGRIVEVGAG